MSVGLSARGKRRRAALAVALACATLLLYWPSTGHDFVPFDDQVYVTQNPQVLPGVTLTGLRWSLTAVEGGNWHPLTWWSHMLDVQLFGARAGGHHLTSILFHTAAGVTLFAVLAALTGLLWPSFLAAALFALHPLHVESVAWVAERKDVLAGFFWMTALGAYLGYVRRPSRRRYLPVVVLFALGLMSKPMVVTLPLVLLLLDFWPLGRTRPSPARRDAAALLVEKAPLLLLSVAAGLMAMKAQIAASSLEPLADVPGPFWAAMAGMRVANAVSSYAIYLAKAVWPHDLAVFYPYPVHTPALWRSAALSAGLLTLVTVFAVRARRRAPYLVVGWLWYLVTLLPVIGLLQVGAQGRADRYTYLPLVGVFIMAAWGLRDLQRRRPGLRPAIALLVLAALLASTVAASRQIGYWRDGATLFRHALAVTPDNYLAHRVLGDILKGKGEYTGAEGHYRAALRLSPRSPNAHNRLGMALSGQGRLEEAVAEYCEAARLAPDNHEVRNNLGVDLTALGRLPEAEEHLRAAARLSPGTAEIFVNLGDNLARQGKVNEAVLGYRRALELKPDLTPARVRLERLLSLSVGR